MTVQSPLSMFFFCLLTFGCCNSFLDSQFSKGSKKMEHKGNSWHETCFTCQRCQQPIGTKSFIPKDNSNFCVPCYEKQFAMQCVHCKKVRDRSYLSRNYDCMSSWDKKKKRKSNNMTFMSWSPSPLAGWPTVSSPGIRTAFFAPAASSSCLARGSPLEMTSPIVWTVSATFTPRSAPPAPPQLAVRINDWSPWICIKRLVCNWSLSHTLWFSPLGLGGSKYISFEERQWHNDCFNCKKCSVSLVGRGFLTERDDILCPECGKDI